MKNTKSIRDKFIEFIEGESSIITKMNDDAILIEQNDIVVGVKFEGRFASFYTFIGNGKPGMEEELSYDIEFLNNEYPFEIFVDQEKNIICKIEAFIRDLEDDVVLNLLDTSLEFTQNIRSGIRNRLINLKLIY